MSFYSFCVILLTFYLRFHLDSAFVLDFLLTFRTFMSTHALWEQLLANFAVGPQGVEAEAAQAAQKRARRKIVSVVRLWILNHHIDYELDSTLIDMAHRFLEVLQAAQLEAEHDLIIMALSARGLDTRSRPRMRPNPMEKLPTVKKTDTISSKSTMSKKRSVRVREKAVF